MTGLSIGPLPSTDNPRVWATWYAARGLCVFPLRPRTKAPYGATRGHHDATTDARVIADWWDQWPASNIGIACQAAGLAVIDIDPRNGGDEVDLGPVPETWRVQTGAGTHLYFGYDGDALRDGTLCPGVDVKFHGYAVAPPSVHPNGRLYVWEAGFSPADLALAPLPEALAARAADRVVLGCDPLRHDATALTIPGGVRNATLFRLGCLLRRYGITDPALTQCLAAINAHQADPPLVESELVRIAASCLRYATGGRA